MDSNLNTLKILKSINNLKRYFINIGEAIKGLENLDLSEVAKLGGNKEATLTKICELLTDVKNGVNNIGTISDKQIDALFE